MPSYPSNVEIIEGEPLRYYVKSRSGDVRRLVDLAEYDGNGQCNCQQFAYRIEPKLKLNVPHGPSTECWHISQAKRYFCQRMIDAVLVERGETTVRTQK